MLAGNFASQRQHHQQGMVDATKNMPKPCVGCYALQAGAAAVRGGSLAALPAMLHAASDTLSPMWGADQAVAFTFFTLVYMVCDLGVGIWV